MTKKCNEKFIHTIVSGTSFVKPLPVYECCMTDTPTNELPPPTICVVLATRWLHNHNLDYCDISEGFNTGILYEYEYQEEKLGDGPWYANGNTRFTPVYNTTACPLRPHRIAMYVGLVYDIPSEVDIPYSLSTINVNTTIAIGYNYLFLSLPADKSFLIKDGTGIDITYLFVYIQDDVREGFRDNKIYRKNPKYFSETSLPFTILIY